MNKQLLKMQHERERQNRIEQGFYDGRFAPKVIKNKKKEFKNKYYGTNN